MADEGTKVPTAAELRHKLKIDLDESAIITVDKIMLELQEQLGNTGSIPTDIYTTRNRCMISRQVVTEARGRELSVKRNYGGSGFVCRCPQSCMRLAQDCILFILHEAEPVQLTPDD